MAYTYSDDPEYPRITPAVQWLIAINVAIYFLQTTVVRASAMQDALGFERADLPYYWWKAATYMFVHGGFWHLAFNMYSLWLFGPRVEHSWTSGRFTLYFFVCGLGAWLAHAAFFPQHVLIGASGAVFGVMYAFANQWPDEEVILFFAIPVKVKVLVMILVAFNLIMAMSMYSGGGGGVSHLAHIGGFAAGWLYLRAPSTQNLDKLRQRVAQIPDIPDEAPRAIPRSLPRPREKMPEADEAVAKSNAVVTKRPPAAVTVGKAPVKPTDELNQLLDKISQQGLESLTNDERRLLEDMSNKLRGG